MLRVGQLSPSDIYNCPENECPWDSGAYRHECPGGHFAGRTTMPTTPVLVPGHVLDNKRSRKVKFDLVS